MGNSHWKIQISNVTQSVRSWKSCGHSSMKKFPLHLWQERSFLCNGEDTKFRFGWLNTCPQIRKKGVKWLMRGQNTGILGQTLWKQTEPISLIFNRPEAVKSYNSLGSNLRDEKERGLENSHMCNLKKVTLRSMKTIGGTCAPPPPSALPPVRTALSLAKHQCLNC